MGKGSSIVISREVPDCDKHSQLTLDLPISRSSFQLLFLALHSPFQAQEQAQAMPPHL